VQGKFHSITKQFTDAFGYSSEDIVGESSWDTIHPDDAKRILDMMKVNQRGGSVGSGAAAGEGVGAAASSMTSPSVLLATCAFEQVDWLEGGGAAGGEGTGGKAGKGDGVGGAGDAGDAGDEGARTDSRTGQWLKLDLIEYRRRHKNGRYIPVRTNGQCVVRGGQICQEETILTVRKEYSL
jgi:hypothetical protein